MRHGGARLELVAKVAGVVRDVLVCLFLAAGMVVGLMLLAVGFSDYTKPAPLPSYCFADDARSTAPECQ
jgi:hypothetical protein